MSTRRVRLQADDGSPLRISVAGADANNAEFDDLLFDGNQHPLRRAQVSLTTVANRSASNLAPALYRAVNLNRTYPAGKFPIFTLYGRVSWVNATDPGASVPQDESSGHYWAHYMAPTTNNLLWGVGGGVDSGHFYAINYTANLNDTIVGTATIWFLIFNNIF